MLPVFQIPVLTFEILKNQRALTKLNLSFSSLCILTGADRIPVLTLGFDSESQLSECLGKPHLEQRQLPLWVQRYFRSTMHSG